MMEQRRSTDDIAAAKRCLAIYGADLTRWPADARARWGDLAISEALKVDRSDADALDALLNDATPPQTPHDLKERITGNYHPHAQRVVRDNSLWTGLDVLSAWLRPAPAGAFAGLAAVGFIVAAVTEQGDALTPEYEAYAYLEESGVNAFNDEAGALWDAE